MSDQKRFWNKFPRPFIILATHGSVGVAYSTDQPDITDVFLGGYEPDERVKEKYSLG